MDNLQEEVDRIKKTCRRMRDYAWKEEMEKIHEILLNRLESLLTIPAKKELVMPLQKWQARKKPMNSPDESENLFQLERESNDVVVFNIPERNATTIELDFVIPRYPGFCHAKNEFYLAGGYLEKKWMSEF